QTETAITGRLTAKRDALAPVDAAFNETTNSGISSAMNNFFGAFRDLEANPSSVPLRTIVAEKGTALAEAFNSTRSRLTGIQQDADNSLRSAVDDVNRLAAQVADLNVKIKFAEGTQGSASELRDKRDEAVRQLSEITGARAIETDGMVTLSLADGQQLVAGGQATQLQAVSTPPNGLATIQINGGPAAINDGRLRGLLDAIGEIGGHITALDDMAAEITSRVNTLHTSGTDLDGNAGVNFFAVPAGGGAVTAANFSVSSAVKSNSRLVVASPLAGSTSAGTIAGAISNLLSDTSSQVGARTGSFNSIYSSIVSDAGAGISDAENALKTQQAILDQTTSQREAVSGVSLDEEAISLLQYQKAYEAAARFIKIADEMTQTIFAIAQ
ncbi:MAG: flagellar hook-associated protein FlgK, partial [Acidobacteriota bacterium]|nr:flagellar hook-associated protein FlgK [Acidobacteriota bacterium]